MNAFTPGPWIIDQYGSIKTPNGRTLVADGVAFRSVSTPETAANAQLISAAPDLYGALKDLLFNAVHGNGCEAHYQVQERARFALAKAEGRS